MHKEDDDFKTLSFRFHSESETLRKGEVLPHPRFFASLQNDIRKEWEENKKVQGFYARGQTYIMAVNIQPGG
jgi:hypothetical protein